MAVSRKDFEAVARVIDQERTLTVALGNEPARIAVTAVAHGIASHFAQENPRFDRDRFLTACGLPPMVRL